MNGAELGIDAVDEWALLREGDGDQGEGGDAGDAVAWTGPQQSPEPLRKLDATSKKKSTKESRSTV